jgi:hypothetical protein
LDRMTKSAPTVSVAMITYNQEPFIAQAIESVLMQETEFACELVIGEDCSTDGTREIVAEFARRYPERIRPLLHDHNLGLQGKNNLVATLNECRGQYIAGLEGDDYWTNPHKLQKQVNFLTDHRECALSFHSVWQVWEKAADEPRLFAPPGKRTVYDISELLSRTNFIHTSSVLLRNWLSDGLPSWFWACPQGDLPFLVATATRGKIGYLDEAMSCYRMHAAGVHSLLPLSTRIENVTRAYQIMGPHLDRECQGAIRQGLRRYGMLALRYAWYLSQNQELDQAREYCALSMRLDPRLVAIMPIMQVKLLLNQLMGGGAIGVWQAARNRLRREHGSR